MPYKMPMSRHKHDHAAAKIARRSMDNLSSNTQTMAQQMPRFNPARRMSKSEQTSPKLRPNLFGNYQGSSDSQLSTVDFASLDPVRTNDTIHSATSESAMHSTDPMSSLPDNYFDPWSALPSGDSQSIPNNNPFGVWPTQHDVSGLTQPALTAASSGTQSEVDEVPVMEDVFGSGMPSIQEDVSNPNGNGMMSGNSNQINRHSLPPNFFSNTDFAMSGFNNDWAAQFNNPYDNMNETMKSSDMAQPTMFDTAWQVPVSQPTTAAPTRSMGGLPFDSNAKSIPQSAGTATPSEDIMRSLFPGMDFDNDNNFAGGDSTFKQNAQTAAPSVTNGMDMGNLSDQDMAFATQSWNDGSLSVPNDTFASPYAFPDEFTSQGYSSGWNQYVGPQRSSF